MNNFAEEDIISIISNTMKIDKERLSTVLNDEDVKKSCSNLRI